ncbi:O-acetyl-ADP-ribose deacetylase [Pectobacterium brasiliense]|uniref:O-acetyl-ADP-ribose deacetylase n=1 Tax=Pectobacterium brasiliense TaxID=180957 RepID=UPI0019698783|nr:O-acetyl-ADP-ribose deacetylase [Pectobacterium brasiliense]MBN3159514.1 O-acetyl-ADP-ribose deacetylase [Pectobacterium brasiliense]
MKNKIHIINGDITKINVDAIVNAANGSLLGGSGVDGAIHRAGGKQILDECQKIRAKQGGCKVGEAVVTTAGNLPAKYIIHTVGPYWSGGGNREYELLYNCYLNCFIVANEKNITSISFPNISTGIYNFPKKKAAEIALRGIKDSLSLYENIQRVNVVCFEIDNYLIYQDIIS